MKWIIFLFIAMFSYSVNACVAPYGGKEYDSLIELERTEKNQYQITVPSKLEDLKNAEIILAYGKGHAGGIPIYEPYEVLEAIVKKGKSTARFSIEKREDTKPYIVVMWWPQQCCFCGIQANSDFIEPE